VLGNRCLLTYGIDPQVIEEQYECSIKPFLTTLNEFPKMQAVLHYSGPVLSWIERNKPEMITLLQDLVGRKQAEFLSGGFYEGVIPLFPQVEISQIEMLTTYLRKAFGKRPLGAFVPSESWEQSQVSVFASCGISYIFLKDALLAGSGAARGLPRTVAVAGAPPAWLAQAEERPLILQTDGQASWWLRPEKSVIAREVRDADSL
jgi:predicted glycosyl hydrolase (DUF1957 family)